MVKKSIKLGIAAFAVVAIALGIGIGVGQKNSQKASSSNLSEVSNVYAAYDMDCVKARRELVVPGTEEYHGSPTKRRMLFRKKVSKISNRQTRKLGKENVPAVFNDEGFIKPEEIEDYGSGSSSSSGSGKSGKSGGSGGTTGKSGKSGGSGSATGKSGKSDGSGSSSSKASKVNINEPHTNDKLQIF